MKKKLYLGILIICLVSFCNRAQAQTFEMDGIYYSVIGADNTAVEVVSPETGTTYEGDIAIPASVFYGGETYWVTRIGDGAFQVCYNLTSIELPAGLTSIGKEAFRDCSGLTTIDFPAGLTSIEDEAFLRCGGLTAIELPAGLTSLGESVFEDCRGLTTMDLPAGLRSLGGYAFAGCSGLATINLPAGLTSLGEYVFSNCVSLTSIDLPAGLTTVGGYAFLGCSDLTTIELPAGFTAIAEGMFSGCSGLTSIEMPAGIRDIGKYAFSDCSSLTSIELPVNLTAIAEGVFSGCSGLAAIELPAGIRDIGKSAFEGCSGLTTIDLPTGLTAIAEEIFSGCSGLTSVDLPAGVQDIGAYAFENCSGLTSIDLPADLTSIAEGVFSGCSGLTAIELPSSLTSIAGFAFSGCSGLTAIEMPAGIQDIGEYAFFGCSGLTTVELPAELTSIAQGVFSGCSGLTAIELPAGLQDIGESAFSGCNGLTAIELPAGLQRIGWDAFMGTDSLKEIFLWASSWPELDNPGIFEGRSGLVLYTFISEPSDNAAWNSVSEKVVLSVSLGETLHVYDGSVPPVSISGNISSFYMDVIQDSMEVGAGSYQYKELYFWFGRQGDEANKKISKAALPEPYLSYTITKAPLKVTAGSYTMTYGEELPEFELIYDGFVNGEDSTVLDSQPVIACEAGEHPDAGEYAITVSGGEATNYDLSWQSGTLTVEKAPLKVTAGSYTITYGDEVPEFELSYDGFVNGEDSTVLASQPVIACEAGENPDAGEYAITVSGGEADNYEFAEYMAGKLTVKKAPLTVIAGSYTMTYGDKLPEFELSYDGFVNGEDSTVLASQPIIACEAGENPDAGEYAITVSGGEADNYEFEYVAGKLTVEKAAQTIEWNQEFAEEVLAGTEILLDATASSGLEVSYASSNEEVAVVRQEDGQSKVVCIAEGEVEITAFQAGDKNHEAAEDVRKTLRVKADVGNEPAWASGIELYPNPVRDELKIQGTNAGMKIRVFHANGHAISLPQGGELQASDGLTILRVGSLPSGLYLLQLVQDGQTRVLRFVKE